MRCLGRVLRAGAEPGWPALSNLQPGQSARPKLQFTHRCSLCTILPADVAPVIIAFVCKVPIPVLVQKVGSSGAYWSGLRVAGG